MDKDLDKLILRAEALMKHNWLHAVQLLEKAVEDNPRDPRPLIALGEFYQRRQIFSKSVKCFQSALKLKPQDDHLKLVIGNTYFAEGEYELAIVYYDQIDKPHPDVRYNKALALAYLGQHRQSIAIMLELLDMIDNNPFIYFLLIEQLLRVEDYSSARDHLLKAEAKIGPHRHLLLLKALTYAHFQNWLFAYNAFRSYEANGDFFQTEHVMIYAECAAKSGMKKQAIPILQKGIEHHPYSIGLYEELIRMLIQQKKLAQAKAYLEQAQRFFPTLSPLLNLMKSRLLSHKD